MTAELVTPYLENELPLYLAEEFAEDPFTTLESQNQELFDMYHNDRADDDEKEQRLDDYFKRIELLDRMTFPDMEGNVESGVPTGYLPDGFTDMGSLSDLNPSERFNRSMNYVDTYNTLHRHKELFSFIFTNLDPNDFTGPDAKIHFQQTIISNIAREIAITLPYGKPIPQERGGILPISDLDKAVCQQHALTAQVLMQAFGIRARLSKNYYATKEDMEKQGEGALGGDHVSNVVVIDGAEQKMYMFDPTNPQLNKSGKWMMGLFRMEERAQDGGWLVSAQDGRRRKYTERDNMYWTIQRAT